MPALIEIIDRDGEFNTNSDFKSLLVVRAYLHRNDMPLTLQQRAIPGGYSLKLTPKK